MVEIVHKNTLPLVTVGLAFYNVEKTLASAVKSVLLQTYDNFEFILIDDGSTDDSFTIAESLAILDDRIILINGEKNMGVGYRLNQITDLANGEYIVRMDADDLMLPDKIEKQMTVLLADPQLDLIDCNAYIIDKWNCPVGKRKANDLSNLTLRKILKSRTVFFHPTVIAKTGWFKANRYDENFRRGPDFELWCRTFGKTNYARLINPLFIYREGKVSICNYELNMESFRRSLKMYHINNLSPFELQKEIMISHIKTFMYRIFGFFNLQHLLTATRNTQLNGEEKEKINSYIEYIKELDLQQDFSHNTSVKMQAWLN